MKLRAAIIALLLAAPCFAWGQATDTSAAAKPAVVVGQAPEAAAKPALDVKALVMGHVSDSYEWEITTIGKRPLIVPLPVIVLGRDGAWHVFSSARLREGATYEGFTIASGGDHSGKIVEADGQRPRLDISLTKTAFALMFNSLVLLLLIMPLARWYRRGKVAPPKGLPGAVEMLVEYVNDEVIKPCLGEEESRRYAPLLLTFFFFILTNNMLGLIPFFPGGANVTGNIAVTGVLAAITFVVVNVSGTKEYWKEIFWPEVPTWLKVPAPIMPLIEFFGVFTKPFALAVRLFANVFAGHSVIVAMVSVIFITATMGAAVSTGMTVVSVVFAIFMFCMELLVGFIQAYVFTLLSALFISLAKVKPEHENHEK